MAKTALFILISLCWAITSCKADMQYDKLEITVDPTIDLRNIKVETGMYPIQDANTGRESSMCRYDLVFDGKPLKKIEGNYNEIDFFITYNNKYYYQFTYPKLDKGQNIYSFNFASIDGKIGITATISGPYPNKFSRNLIKLSRLDSISINKKEDINGDKYASTPLPIVPEILEPFDFNIFAKSTVHTFNRVIGSNTHVRKAASYAVIDDQGYGQKFYYTRTAGDGKTLGHEYTNHPIYFISKEFSPAGQLELIGIESWFGFKVGKWNTYNYKGDLISSRNYDEGYNFEPKKIFKLCRENDISLIKVKGGIKQRTYIRKEKSSEYGDIWVVEYFKVGNKTSSTMEIQGNTGKILSKKSGSITVK